MQLTTEIQHDEINLFRLLRRLEKSAQPPTGVSSEDARQKVWSQAQKELQKVKYARKLVKNVEGYERESDSSEHIRRLNAVKIALDKIESSLKTTQTQFAPTPRKPPSLLDQLPPPRDDTPLPSSSFAEPPSDAEPITRSSSGTSGSNTSFASAEDEPLSDGQTTPKATSQGPIPAPLPLSPTTDNFLLTPPDEFPGLPSSGLVSALPALMSADPTDLPPAYRSSTTTALPPSSSTLLPRKPQGKDTTRTFESHTAIQNDLSAQLEQMAAQLKRNALHFASALEKDRTVVENAQGKVEVNLGFMEVQRGRLKEFAGRSRKSTWMTMAIVLVVLFVFLGMVGFIRATRFYN